ncbi:MAG: hypothetical protein KDA37_05885, partial [Planctomycetales bacterium]|nr:hypothetical protein [Planctomycetales bacterium]
YDRRYDRLGPAVVNLFGEDQVIENLTIENTQQSSDHAFAVFGNCNRTILDNCNVLSEGGDTLSLWNTSHGMYYHRNCRFRGGVDFVCPRGWCYVLDSDFESAGSSAAVWQDGHMDPSMKFVMRDCRFDGPKDFWLGRNHYPSQFYFLNCRFTKRMADKPILVVSEPPPSADASLWERKYFLNCHREGGDYAWFADNLNQAEGAPTITEITPRWTFDGRWNPERTDPVKVDRVYTQKDTIHVYFSERLSGADHLEVLRADGSKAPFLGGEGTRHFVFTGGTEDSPPLAIQGDTERLSAITAALQTRGLGKTRLPAAEPWKPIKVVLVGDSTVASNPPDNQYQGWGWALGEMLDSRAQVVNLAANGRSSKSFRNEGRWDKALAEKPDVVIIQFGHNDNLGKGIERETDPGEHGFFRENLRRYAHEARLIGATPVLVSPTTRRIYLADGRIDPNEKNVPYAEATMAVAEEINCAVIDLNTLTRELFNRYQEEHCNWMQPVGDRTHFTQEGARRIAAIVAGELAEKLELFRGLVLPEELPRH